jgi:magnesium transporter
VLNHYGDLSREHAWLVWFVPLVLASGGNAGSQSATLLIRTLALRDLGRVGGARVAARELAAGMSLGLFLGALGFCLALLYVKSGHALVVGATVMLVVTMGAVTGAMLPILFQRLGMDPALMSNPLIASLSDVMGLLIYYNVAFLILSLVAK